MPLAGQLIVCRRSGQFNTDKPAVLKQHLYIPIDGSNADGRMILAGILQYLFGRQRTIRLQKGIAKGRLLFGVSLVHRLIRLDSQQPIFKLCRIETKAPDTNARNWSNTGFSEDGHSYRFLVVWRRKNRIAWGAQQG